MGLDLIRKGKRKGMKEHILEGVFPVGEVHIVAGGSGAGKTTFILDLIEKWRKGEDWFGHKSNPKPFLYISGDRSEYGILRTFDRVGIDPDNFDIYVPKAAENALELLEMLKKLRAKYPKVEVFWIEGFASKVPKGKLNDYDIVSKWLKQLQDWCAEERVTIIAVCHSPKSKEEDSYEDPRHKVMGSMAWSAYSETIIIIEPVQASNPESKLRRLMILPRNYPAEVYKLSFQDGMLVPMAAGGVPGKITNIDLVRAWLRAYGVGEEFNVAEAEEATGVSGSSLRKELQNLVILKEIKKSEKRGWYVVVKAPLEAAPLDIMETQEVESAE